MDRSQNYSTDSIVTYFPGAMFRCSLFVFAETVPERKQNVSNCEVGRHLMYCVDALLQMMWQH